MFSCLHDSSWLPMIARSRGFGLPDPDGKPLDQGNRIPMSVRLAPRRTSRNTTVTLRRIPVRYGRLLAERILIAQNICSNRLYYKFF